MRNGPILRNLCTLVMMVAIAACVGSGDGGKHGKRPAPPVPSGGVTAGRVLSDSPETKQCLTQLRKQNIRYEQLADRWYGGGCSALSSVKVADVGTPLSVGSTLSCPMASKLAQWNREIAQPAARKLLGKKIARIDIMGSYSCRPVNGVAGNKLSEHGRANAIDIGGFTLADGRKITVLDGWNGKDDRVRKFLREVHKGACGEFQIVLGPNANRWHANHFHFDMGKGPYCR